MHDGARVAAIVAFFTLVDIEMDKHRTPPLPLAETFLTYPIRVRLNTTILFVLRQVY